MISRTRKIVDSLLLIMSVIIALFVGYCYSCVSGSKDCNVLIEGTKNATGFLGEYTSYFMGSGVVVSKDGYVLTAGHCVRDTQKLRVTLRNGKSYEISEYFVPEDPNFDFGIIKLPADVNDFKPLGNSDLAVGWIYNIGNAKGIWEDSFFFGTVYNSHFKRMVFGKSEYILAKITIWPGCSGGGVYKYKELVGVVSMKPDEDGCLIVPTNVIKTLWGSCKSHKVGEQLNR